MDNKVENIKIFLLKFLVFIIRSSIYNVILLEFLNLIIAFSSQIYSTKLLCTVICVYLLSYGHGVRHA